MPPQTKKLLQCKLGGLTGTIEGYTEPSMKRASEPIAVVKGDGQSRVEYLHDPVLVFQQVTLTVIVDQNEAFVANARALMHAQRRDPGLAGPVVIQSLKPDGTPVTRLTLARATIQEVRMPDGDTMQHAEGKASIVVQPSDIF